MFYIIGASQTKIIKRIFLPFQESHMQEHYHSRLLFENNNKQFVYRLVHLGHLVNITDLIQPVKITILTY